MQQITHIIGGSGSGKTTKLLQIMQEMHDAGIQDPMSLGFVSFTRAARREAASRAAKKFNVSLSDLEELGWFRTIHSVCYRALKCGNELLTGDRGSKRWIEAALNESLSSSPIASDLEVELTEDPFASATDAGIVLLLWDCARHRLEPVRVVWERMTTCNGLMPGYDTCVSLIERYEQAKRLDGRCDFTDMIARFAGWEFTIKGPEPCTPDGDVPALPVWFHDEMQDSTALLDSAFRRLTSTPECQHVFVAGDNFQSIYGFGGAEPSHFLNWRNNGAHCLTLPKSHRCPKPIHELGELILRGCSDYWDRKIQPADHNGDVSRVFGLSILRDIDPTETWLLLARTRRHAGRMAAKLNRTQIPWVPTSGIGRWNNPKRQLGLSCLYHLEKGAVVGGVEWQQAIKLLPNTFQGEALLAAGTRERFSKTNEAKLFLEIVVSDLTAVGGTAVLSDLLRNRQWRGIVDGGHDFAAAADRYGLDLVQNPRVRVGTVHSAKGAEADNVFYLTTTTKAVTNGQMDPAGHNEECRVNYVAVTRARKQLIVANEPSRQHRARLPL